MRGLLKAFTALFPVWALLFSGAATTIITQRNKRPIYERYKRLLGGGTKPTLAELQPGTQDRSHDAADAEGRGGIRSRTSRSAHEDTPRPGHGSIGRVYGRAVTRARREFAYHALRVREMSIHVLPSSRSCREHRRERLATRWTRPRAEPLEALLPLLGGTPSGRSQLDTAQPEREQTLGSKDLGRLGKCVSRSDPAEASSSCVFRTTDTRHSDK